MARVSVVIPTFNGALHLAKSIQSVLDQTYQDLEVIVVDDASTDCTLETVSQFCDRRLRCVRHEANRGVAAARNTGVKAATGEYLAFNDSDDEWMPHKLERQIGVISTLDLQVGVVYSDMWMVWRSDEKLGEYYRAQHIMPADGIVHEVALGFGIGCYLQTAVIRRECFDKVGTFDEELRRLEDTEFFMRVSRHYYFYHIAEPLVTQFMSDGSLTQDKRAIAQSYRHLLDKYQHELPPKAMAVYHADIGKALASSSWRKVAGRHLAASVSDFLKACWHFLVALRKDWLGSGRDLVGAAISVLRKSWEGVMSRCWRRIGRTSVEGPARDGSG